MSYIDFNVIKAAFRLEDVAELVGLELKQEGKQFRIPCPACKSGGDRAIVLTPAKDLFFCFSAKKGGDVIGLAAHLMQVTNHEAAAFLQEQLGEQPTAPTAPTRRVEKQKSSAPSFDAEKFAEKLEYADDTARALLIGTYRGRLYMGHRYASGTISGFTYFADGALTHPKEWQPDASNVVKLKRPA